MMKSEINLPKQPSNETFILQVVSNSFVTCNTQIQVASYIMQGFQQPSITSSYAYVLVYGYSDI